MRIVKGIAKIAGAILIMALMFMIAVLFVDFIQTGVGAIIGFTWSFGMTTLAIIVAWSGIKTIFRIGE